jgi:hypothetical protein
VDALVAQLVAALLPHLLSADAAKASVKAALKEGIQ